MQVLSLEAHSPVSPRSSRLHDSRIFATLVMLYLATYAAYWFRSMDEAASVEPIYRVVNHGRRLTRPFAKASSSNSPQTLQDAA